MLRRLLRNKTGLYNYARRLGALIYKDFWSKKCPVFRIGQMVRNLTILYKKEVNIHRYASGTRALKICLLVAIGTMPLMTGEILIIFYGRYSMFGRGKWKNQILIEGEKEAQLVASFISQ